MVSAFNIVDFPIEKIGKNVQRFCPRGVVLEELSIVYIVNTVKIVYTVTVYTVYTVNTVQ